MSLRSNLNQIIKDRNGGIFTQQELEKYCHTAHYKISNAERRLRPSESPNIEPVTKNGAIVGYRWKQGTNLLPGAADFMREWGSKKVDDEGVKVASQLTIDV